MAKGKRAAKASGSGQGNKARKYFTAAAKSVVVKASKKLPRTLDKSDRSATIAIIMARAKLNLDESFHHLLTPELVQGILNPLPCGKVVKKKAANPAKVQARLEKAAQKKQKEDHAAEFDAERARQAAAEEARVKSAMSDADTFRTLFQPLKDVKAFNNSHADNVKRAFDAGVVAQQSLRGVVFSSASTRDIHTLLIQLEESVFFLARRGRGLMNKDWSKWAEEYVATKTPDDKPVEQRLLDVAKSKRNLLQSPVSSHKTAIKAAQRKVTNTFHSVQRKLDTMGQQIADVTKLQGGDKPVPIRLEHDIDPSIEYMQQERKVHFQICALQNSLQKLRELGVKEGLQTDAPEPVMSGAFLYPSGKQFKFSSGLSENKHNYADYIFMAQHGTARMMRGSNRNGHKNRLLRPKGALPSELKATEGNIDWDISEEEDNDDEEDEDGEEGEFEDEVEVKDDDPSAQMRLGGDGFDDDESDEDYVDND